MPLQILFGDDEHTASDGPYARVLKTRKWLYISAATATVLALGLYDAEAARAALKIVSLPFWLLGQGLLFGLVYLLVQYGFLVGQLVVTYDIVLSDRLAFRREDELSAARSKVISAQSEIGKYKDARPKPDLSALDSATREYESNLEELQRVRAEIGPDVDDKEIDISDLKSLSSSGKIKLFAAQRAAQLSHGVYGAAKRQVEEREERLSEPDPIYVSLEESLREAGQSLIHISSQDPARRRGYKKMEVLIDIVRVAPPLVFATVAAINLLISLYF